MAKVPSAMRVGIQLLCGIVALSALAGIGIGADDLKRIFEPFYQVAGRNSEGIGLGLAITRRLVEAIGGELVVASELGRGTTFALTLETEAQRGEAALPRAERGVEGYRGRRRSVLVVDDNADNRAVLCGWLARMGFIVNEAADGEGAVAAVARLVPDLVLLDLVMPGVDGLAVAKQVRALELPRQPKVVAVTANALEEARRRSLAEGCDAFLTKPVDFDELCVTLGALLGLEWQYTDAVEPRPAYSSVPTAVPSVPSQPSATSAPSTSIALSSAASSATIVA